MSDSQTTCPNCGTRLRWWQRSHYFHGILPGYLCEQRTREGQCPQCLHESGQHASTTSAYSGCRADECHRCRAERLRRYKERHMFTEEGDWTAPDVLAEVLNNGEGAVCTELRLEKLEETRD